MEQTPDVSYKVLIRQEVAGSKRVNLPISSLLSPASVEGWVASLYFARELDVSYAKHIIAPCLPPPTEG
jgi:hypothetical protein